MELESLEIFLAVAQAGNFSRVARDRNIAVSSIARRIELLEEDIGVPLFNRGTRGVLLTDAGQHLVGTAQKMLAEMADARDAITEMTSEPRGVLTVTAPATFGRRHVAPAVASFLLRYPSIQIDLHVADQVVDLVAQRVDVAVRIGVLENSDLIASTLAPQRRVAVASPAYLARVDRPASPEDLLKHNCLTHSGLGARVGWWQFAGVNADKPLAIRGSLRSDDSESLMKAALAGVGVAHLATWLVGEEVSAGRLVVLFNDELKAEPASGSSIHAIRVPGRSVLKARLFIEHLRETFFPIKDDRRAYWERQFLG